MPKTIALLLVFSSPVYASTFVEQAVNITSDGSNNVSIGYIPFSLSDVTVIDIAANGGDSIDPELVLFHGNIISDFTLADVIVRDDDGCLDLDCGKSRGTSFSSLVNLSVSVLSTCSSV